MVQTDPLALQEMRCGRVQTSPSGHVVHQCDFRATLLLPQLPDGVRGSGPSPWLLEGGGGPKACLSWLLRVSDTVVVETDAERHCLSLLSYLGVNC